MPEEDINVRLARLEAWMDSAHWPADPVRLTPPDAGPNGELPSEVVQERAEREARESVLSELRRAPDIGSLESRIARLEDRFNTLHGQGGIRVTGSVIEYIPPRRNLDGGSTLEIREEGGVVSTSPAFINFIGAAVTAAASGDGASVTITGGDTTSPSNSGTGAGVLKLATNVVARSLKSANSTLSISEGTDEITFTIAPLVVQDEGSEVVSGVTTINFTGEGVDVTDTGGGSVKVDISGTKEDYAEATYIMVQVQVGGTLEAHEVTISGNDLGEYVES